MNSHRSLVGVFAVVILGLGIWIARLQGQITDLEAQLADVPETEASTASMPHVGEDAQPMRHRGPRAHRGGGGPAPRPGSDARIAADDGGAPSPGEGEERRGPDWEALRTEMQTRTIDTVEAFGTQNGWSPETTDEVVAILLDTGDAIGDVWGAVREGELTHYQARKEMRALHDESGVEIIALVGEPAYEQLEEHLFEARHEAWRSSGEGRRRH